MPSTVLILGTLDTKGVEFALLEQLLQQQGLQTLMMDTGVMESYDGLVDVTAQQVAEAAGTTLVELRERNDRGHAMQVMSQGAARLVSRMYENRPFDAIISMGGTGGTSVACAAMRALPLGLPKICITTMASSDTSGLTQGCDIVLVPSIVDVSGINSISTSVMARAAGMLAVMVGIEFAKKETPQPTLAASMFGNTTKCINACREHFEAAGCEVLVFHATGTGGRTMESLIRSGAIDGVLDLTTTELADELCGGIFSAGPSRLTAAAQLGIPQVVAPGCLDMVNFGPRDTVPAKYVDAGRLLYEWNSATTLMRTNAEENKILGQMLAERINQATGPVAVLLPLRGVSVLDGDGGLFANREYDQACFNAIRQHLRGDIPVVEVDANINDSEFSQQAIALLEGMLPSVAVPQGVSAV